MAWRQTQKELRRRSGYYACSNFCPEADSSSRIDSTHNATSSLSDIDSVGGDYIYGKIRYLLQLPARTCIERSIPAINGARSSNLLTFIAPGVFHIAAHSSQTQRGICVERVRGA